MKKESLISQDNKSKTKPFEFQNWSVYEKALEFVINAQVLCHQLPKDSATGLRDQLRRASQSIPLNIAEGSSRDGKKDKMNFWRIARGSVFECVAILDIIEKSAFTQQSLEVFYNDLTTLGRMLSGPIILTFLKKVDA